MRYAGLVICRQRPGTASGVLFKNAGSIELMRNVDTLVVDKTGTLTEGRPALVEVIPAGGVPENVLLKLAASLYHGWLGNSA